MKQVVKIIASLAVIAVIVFSIAFLFDLIPEFNFSDPDQIWNNAMESDVSQPQKSAEDIFEEIKAEGKEILTGLQSSSEDADEALVPNYSGTGLQIEIPESNPASGQTMTVEFIDVGQADSILIYTGNHAMLVDAGNVGDGPLVASYIQSLGITHLDYVIGTHAHEDHMGGMDEIIDCFDISYIMLPTVMNDGAKFDDYVVEAANRSSATQIMPSVGSSYDLGGAVWTVLSCETRDDENMNESSIVIKLSFGDIDFMLTGDAEKVNEQEMLQSGFNLDCEILKVGHHGSKTSSSESFLDAVSAEVSVISVGAGNSYGLPADEILATLSASGTDIYRTDELGTIQVVTDGMTYSILNFDTATNSG